MFGAAVLLVTHRTERAHRAEVVVIMVGHWTHRTTRRCSGFGADTGTYSGTNLGSQRRVAECALLGLAGGLVLGVGAEPEPGHGGFPDGHVLPPQGLSVSKY